ncbi:MAG: ParB/RepB/Spo0J family partition protein [Oligoflexales bacterium]
MNCETQIIELGNQYVRVGQKRQFLTIEKLRHDLCNPKLHGKKVDVPLSWINALENHRSKITELKALKLQIQEIGLVQPIGIQLLDNKITVVYGHRRFHAFRELCKKDPIKYAKIGSVLQVYHQAEQGRIIAQAVENLGRQDLSPLDESKAINELKKTLKTWNGDSYTNVQLEEFLGGVHRKTVELAIIIANWPESIHKTISENEDHFSISLLRSIAKKGLKGVDLEFVINSAAHLCPNRAKREQKKDLSLSRIETKNYRDYLNQSNLECSEDEKDFLFSQRKWLGSEKHRALMQKVLREYFA